MEDDMEGLLTAFADGEWDSSNRNFFNDDADFIVHQLFNNEVVEGSSSSLVTPASWSAVENDTNFPQASLSLFHPVGSIYTNSNYCFSGHREVEEVPPCYIAPSDYTQQLVPSEYYMMDTTASPVPSFSNAIPEDGIFIDGLELDIPISIPNMPLNLKRSLDVSAYGQRNNAFPNKKTRMMKNDNGNKMKTLPKKNWKMSMDNSCKQMSSSSSTSEDDSNASQELNAGTPLDTNKLVSSFGNNGKKTSQKGSAIDPQSLYARKRRERINERLRTLQNLVPNGTKVDISTMLEEAVSYVKFLQTQIKLLSSDDLWMYAPIAYNGIDVCLTQNLSARRV